MRPLIGITMDSASRPGRYELHGDYVSAVEQGGGMPLPIPYGLERRHLSELLDRLDGILFSGGDDLDPRAWGENWHAHAVPVDARRQAFELELLAEAERRQLPVLGLCLGCQLMNVYRGGSLIQFLPEHSRPRPLEHRRLDTESRRHPVRLEPQSLLARAIGRNEISVNTSHKQAIGRLGSNLRIIATAPDGVIEGIEDTSLPLFIGLQWHPERLRDEAEHLTPFLLLVDWASRRLAGADGAATRAE